MGLSSIKTEESDTKLDSCFPIQINFQASFNSSLGMQIDSQLKMATFYNKIYSLKYSRLKLSTYLNNVSLKYNVFVVDMFESTFATKQMKWSALWKNVSQVGHRKHSKNLLVLFTYIVDKDVILCYIFNY